VRRDKCGSHFGAESMLTSEMWMPRTRQADTQYPKLGHAANNRDAPLDATEIPLQAVACWGRVPDKSYKPSFLAEAEFCEVTKSFANFGPAIV
jgi:hypothetical protein